MKAPGSPSSALQMTYFCVPTDFETVLHFSGISGAPASAQSASCNLLDDFARGHFSEHFDQRGIAVGRNVIFDAIGIDHAGVLQDNLFLALEEWNVGGADQPRHGSSVQTVKNRRAIGSFYLLVKHSRAGGDERAFRAQAHATYAFDLAVIFRAATFDFLVEPVFYGLALAGETSGRDAYIHPLGEMALCLAFGFGDLIQFLGRHACVHFFRCSRMAGVPTFPATSWS
jgi:hypothetical protein